ncbi:MAG: RNase III inhibitor, partial [Eubacteriaceae bacterium]|nr:RNase III inhibitor [Eubacteriaceae bacterium]
GACGACEAFESLERPSFPELDEGFSDTLLRLIDERGMSDSECYRRANLDRKLFSKIRSNPSYHPSKATAIALAFALELDMKDTESFLKKAGYALSDSYLSDVIVSYFIQRGDHDLFRLNEVLFLYDQPLIGQ